MRRGLVHQGRRRSHRRWVHRHLHSIKDTEFEMLKLLEFADVG